MCNQCPNANKLEPDIKANFLVSRDGHGSSVVALLVLGHLSGLNTVVQGSNPGSGSTATFAVASGNAFSILKYTM